METELKNETVKTLLHIAKEKKIKLSKEARAKKTVLISVIAKAMAEKTKATTKKKKATGQRVDTSMSAGMGVAEYWAHLFLQNEVFFSSRKQRKNLVLTNEQITEAMRTAFPERISAVFDEVNKVRNRYARGVLTGAIEVSFRYIRNEDGKVLRANSRGKAISK